MDDASFGAGGGRDLEQAYRAALGGSPLQAAEAAFIAQVLKDTRPEELPDLATETLAEALAQAWRATDVRTDSAPLIRLSPMSGGTSDADRAGAPALDLLAVLQDDRPFLVDSVMGELGDQGLDVRAMFHPVVSVARDASGKRAPGGTERRESLILVVLGHVGADRKAALCEGLKATLADVAVAVDDFPAMLALMRQVAEDLKRDYPRHGPAVRDGDLDEHLAFLEWLSAEHFVFLGARTYEYPLDAKGDYAAEEPRFRDADSLGVLRDGSRSVLRRASEPAILTSALKDYLNAAQPLVVAKSNLRSRVHRRVYMDYIGVKRYGADGRVAGETRFVGLFTAEAYQEPARVTPLIRRKIEHVLARAGDNPSAYTEKRLRNIVETFPRDELFQITEDQLLPIAEGILHLYDRPRVRLFVRSDPFDRFVSCLLYVPRDRYDSGVRERASEILARAYGGRVSAYYPSFSDQPLARVHIIIGVSPGAHPTPDLRQVEAEIAETARTWTDRFEAAMRGAGGELGDAGALLKRYARAFPAGYQDLYDAAEALCDVREIEALGEAPVAVRAFRTPQDSKIQFRFKLYHAGDAIPIADVLPILEDMGMKALYEEGFGLRLTDGEGAPRRVWVHEFVLEDERGEHLSFADVKRPFEDTFFAVWTGRTESDGFNRLVLELGIDWRQAALVRTLARYRQQSGLDPSQAVQEEALRDHPDVSRLILDLFRIKFDTSLTAAIDERERQADAVFAEIVAALQKVDSLDHDRVLRRLALLVRALKRTNFYQTDSEGAPKPYISVKIASRELDDLPAPKPYREIFVWAPHVEGVHLRFGPVARGGLRWSDRRDDFRTEVLGLVKAQQVKNAVIVPVGSKGGFYPKALPRGGAPDAIRAEGVRAYTTFLSGLLDITDNLDAAGQVIRPAGVIAHEGDDPYLVVAADKGTASFSDIANGVAESYGFWLGDAFASGGSAGYDHKAMGITARGAWEAVKRHFRELGKDIQTEPFLCVGVGDMSGDVFGNGMLLSRATRLVAAFDHRHVFLDPDPDPARSWAERKRMFDLPRSSWDDYDRSLISPGGGVFPRTLKSIPLSPEVKARLQVEADELAPADLIRAILSAPVELLYLGGIGTYVKAASESNADVGDKANDAVRIDASELRVKVVGEGANLGFTQAGRIAFARAGGRINTDAIDNSAGVDTSDHEVNIKILLGQAERAGALRREDRDALLAAMTDEVAAHVLAHNYAQTLALSLQEANAPAELEAQARFMLDLEAKGRLDRKVEGLPRAAAIAELRAAGEGLTRPELAVVTAYGKLELSADIVASKAPDDPYFEGVQKGYFPDELARFGAEMKTHRLRREIIATVLANDIVDMAGPTFAPRLMASAGVDADGLVVAFEAARRIFRLDEAWAAIGGLDLKIDAKAQLALYGEVASVLRGQTYWMARSEAAAGASVQALIDRYRPAADALREGGLALLSDFERAEAEARARRFVDAGAPESCARMVAALRPMTATAEIADLAALKSWPVENAARLFHQTGQAFGFDRLRAAAGALRGGDAYERAALRGLIVELFEEQAARARAILQAADGPQAAADLDRTRAAIARWIEPRKEAVERAARTLSEIERSADGWSFAKLTIANAALRASSQLG